MFDMWSHSPHNIPTIMLLSIKYLSRYHYKCGHLKATLIEPSHCSHQLLKNLNLWNPNWLHHDNCYNEPFHLLLQVRKNRAFKCS